MHRQPTICALTESDQVPLLCPTPKVVGIILYGIKFTVGHLAVGLPIDIPLTK